MSDEQPSLGDLSLERLNTDVEAFLKRHNMKAYLLGKYAINDPMFVNTMREGRDFRLSTVEKVYSFMADYESESRQEA